MDWFDSPPGTVDLVQMEVMTVASRKTDPLVGRMREVGFDVSWAETPREAATKLKRSDSSVAMLGIGSDLPASEVAELCDWVRNHHPELPVACLGTDGTFRLLTDHPIAHDELGQRLQHILWRQFYPEWLIEQLESYVLDTLSSGFGREVTPLQIGIKANRGAYQGIVAILNLSGASAGGRITVYGKPTVLGPLADRLGYAHGNLAERAVDLAGEIANQIAGRFKRDLVRRGIDLSIGVPVLIEGNNLTIRWLEGRPALHLEVLSETGPLSVELCQGMAMPNDADVTTDLALNDGEFELF